MLKNHILKLATFLRREGLSSELYSLKIIASDIINLFDKHNELEIILDKMLLEPDAETIERLGGLNIIPDVILVSSYDKLAKIVLDKSEELISDGYLTPSVESKMQDTKKKISDTLSEYDKKLNEAKANLQSIKESGSAYSELGLNREIIAELAARKVPFIESLIFVTNKINEAIISFEELKKGDNSLLIKISNELQEIPTWKSIQKKSLEEINVGHESHRNRRNRLREEVKKKLSENPEQVLESFLDPFDAHSPSPISEEPDLRLVHSDPDIPKSNRREELRDIFRVINPEEDKDLL